MSTLQRSIANKRAAQFRIWCRESGTEPTRDLRAGFYAGFSIAYMEREALCQSYQDEIARLRDMAGIRP